MKNSSDWLKKWRENLQPITERSNAVSKVYEIGFRQSIHFSPSQTLWVGYLNEVQLRPRFRKKSLNMQISSLPACRRLLFPLCRQISSLVGYFKKANAYLVFFIRFNETVHDKWCLHKSVGQPDNGLERVFDTG